MSRRRGVVFPSAGAVRGWLTSVRARLRLGEVCDCPRHNAAASGYDGCTCAAVDDVDPACPHVRRLRADAVELEGGGWGAPVGALEAAIAAEPTLMTGGRAFVDLPPPAVAAVVSAAAVGRTR